MMPDVQIIHDMRCADRIKAKAPESAVTADAIFLALRASSRQAKPVLPYSGSAGLPCPKFHAALDSLKGQALTVGEFMMLGGMMPARKPQKDAVGLWLRASGRKPRSTGGRRVFDI